MSVNMFILLTDFSNVYISAMTYWFNFLHLNIIPLFVLNLNRISTLPDTFSPKVIVITLYVGCVGN